MQIEHKMRAILYKSNLINLEDNSLVLYYVLPKFTPGFFIKLLTAIYDLYITANIVQIPENKKLELGRNEFIILLDVSIEENINKHIFQITEVLSGKEKKEQRRKFKKLFVKYL